MPEIAEGLLTQNFEARVPEASSQIPRSAIRITARPTVTPARVLRNAFSAGAPDNRPAGPAPIGGIVVSACVMASAIGSLADLVLQLVPELLVQLAEAFAEPCAEDIARSRHRNMPDDPDPPRPGAEHDDAIGQRDRFAEIVRHENHR